MCDSGYGVDKKIENQKCYYIKASSSTIGKPQGLLSQQNIILTCDHFALAWTTHNRKAVDSSILKWWKGKLHNQGTYLADNGWYIYHSSCDHEASTVADMV